MLVCIFIILTIGMNDSKYGEVSFYSYFEMKKK